MDTECISLYIHYHYELIGVLFLVWMFQHGKQVSFSNSNNNAFKTNATRPLQIQILIFIPQKSHD